jgi:hypothetical protein
MHPLLTDLPDALLRFLSLRYEKRWAKLEALIADPASDYHCCFASTAESHTLATLRDLLLPKLLSGEIRLDQAENAVEAAL